MFNFKRILVISSLLAGLVWMLAACGEANTSIAQAATPADSVSVMKSLEQQLNQGQVAQALELFSEQPVVLEVHTDHTSGYYTPGGYYIPRAYSVEAGERLFKGQDAVNSYFSQLIEGKFQSANSVFSEDEAGVTWKFQAADQMEFKATTQAGKIKTLIVTIS